MKNSNAYNSIINQVKSSLYMNTNVIINPYKNALIENCKRILECSELLVKIECSDFYIEIWGDNLCIRDYSTSSVEVIGKITSVSFEYRRRKR